MASGLFTSGVEIGPHWDGSDNQTTFAQIEWDTIFAPDDRLPVEVLKSEVPNFHWDRIQGSGVILPPGDAADLEVLWARHARGVVVGAPEELLSDHTFPEGSVARVEVNRYERDPRARAECLARWGTGCTVCGLDFEARYGTIGKGFIHVHHLRELWNVGDGYRVDPVRDLRPVCPNCHAMLHKERPALAIDALKAMIVARSEAKAER